MSTYAAVLLVQAFQRDSQERRAFTMRKQVLQPRLADPYFRARSMPPLRGAITYNLDVLEQLRRIGCPFGGCAAFSTSQTRPSSFASAHVYQRLVCFLSKRPYAPANNLFTTPFQVEAPHIDQTDAGLLRRIRYLRERARPTWRTLQAY